MTVDDDQGAADFWHQVRLNVTSWLIVAGVGGIGYISYTVPRQLDLILRNQEITRAEITQIKADLKDHNRRITQLETK
jgi:hypothetical protein